MAISTQPDLDRSWSKQALLIERMNESLRTMGKGLSASFSKREKKGKKIAFAEGSSLTLRE